VNGLSTIVSTLIIILLVFVAIGLLWVVVRNFIQGGTDSINLSSKCVDITVSPTNVGHNATASANLYNVTLLRNGGTGDIGGVKLVFESSLGDANFLYDVSGNIIPLGIETVPVTVDLANPNKVSAVVYFVDSKGNKQYCQNSEELSF